jgi:putative transcriptional regulator
MAEVARGTGLAKATVFRLYHATSKAIDFEVMDKLCSFLGVQPGDLFEYIPDEAQEGAKTGRK